jgi:hypothetical protein
MLKLLTVLVVALAGALTTQIAAAQSNAPTGSIAEIALSNDTLQLRYETDGGAMGVDDGRLSGAFFLSEERDTVFSVGLMLPTNLNLGRLSLLLGPQVYAALLEDENQDVMSVSLGAQVRFVLIERLGLALAGHAYYAPDILTFGSADSLTDLAARVELDLAEQVKVFGGMRWFEFDLTEGMGERTLQEELFVGLGYRF